MTQEPSNAHEYRVLIRELHLDSFGHVNNAVYMQLFEEARWEIITSRGFGYKEIHESKLGPTILETHLQFRREIRNRETVTIRTWVAEQTGKITTLKQLMLNGKGEDACMAEFKIGLFDMKARRLVAPTPEWQKAIGIQA